MAILKVNSENFDVVKNSEKTVLVDFYADWCGPCQMLAPTIDAIAAERDDILVCKINCDEAPELAMAYGVTSIPTLMVMKNGEVVNTSMGVRPKDAILAML